MTGTKTMTLTEFLLARIAEDERPCVCLERPTGACGGGWCRDDCRVCSGGDALTQDERVLAECEAKREIVRYYLQLLDNAEVVEQPFHYHATGLLYAVRAHAAVYSDHSDYREEWTY